MPARQQSTIPPVAMDADSSAWKISLFVFVVSSFMWLGAVNVRALIGNDLLNPGTVDFVEYVDPQIERAIYRMLSIASVLIMIGYTVAVLSSAVFLATSPFTFKQHGWLMMSTILFYIFIPVEAYTLHLDWKMIYLEFYTTADNDLFRELFIARLKALRGVPIIALLCYYTIIGLAVFQPFKKLSQKETGVAG